MLGTSVEKHSESFQNMCLVVTGYLGRAETEFKNRPPQGVRGVFFSNNRRTLDQAGSLGWETVDLSSRFEPTDDALESSLQSKWIKFLQFVGEEGEYRRYPWIAYADHKNSLTPAAILRLFSRARGKAVVIRKHAQFRDNVMMEVKASMPQQRYSENMEQTIDWIQRLKSEGYRYRARVPNTGVILWKNSAESLALANEIYESLIELRQPQCQIVWTMLSQKYRPFVRNVSYNWVGIRIKRHPSAVRVWTDRVLSPVRRTRRKLKTKAG